MAKVNMKDTDYYRSGRHLQNVLNAARKGNEVQQAKKQKRVETYYLTPNLCASCNSILEFSKRKNKFCSSSCAATFNNQKRKENGYIVSNFLKEKIAKKAKDNYNNLSVEEKEFRKQRLASINPSKKHQDVIIKCNQCSKEFQVRYIFRHKKHVVRIVGFKHRLVLEYIKMVRENL